MRDTIGAIIGGLHMLEEYEGLISGVGEGIGVEEISVETI